MPMSNTPSPLAVVIARIARRRGMRVTIKRP